jgi:hypothetical protein
LVEVRKAVKKPDLNPNKKQELGKYIESLGWPCINRNKLGGYKVSKKEFAEWEKQGHEEVKTLNEYSKWVIVWNTFIGANSTYDEDDAEYDEEGFEIDPDDENIGEEFFTSKSEKVIRYDATGLWQYRTIDNKVHTTFHAFMTKSHRHRSSNPNLQNLPKRNYEVSQIVRQCYTCPRVVPCRKIEAEEVYVFDWKNGMTLNKMDDIVEIGLTERIKVPAKDLGNYPQREYGYRVEYYRLTRNEIESDKENADFIEINDDILGLVRFKVDDKIMVKNLSGEIKNIFAKDIQIGDIIFR